MVSLVVVKGGGEAALTDDAAYSGGDHVDEFLVGGVFGFDEGGGAFDDGVDGFETGGFHGFSGLWTDVNDVFPV